MNNLHFTFFNIKSKPRILFESIFYTIQSLSFKALRDEVMRRLVVKVTAAENRIKRALEVGIIAKDANQLYALRYEEDIDEMPF